MLFPPPSFLVCPLCLRQLSVSLPKAQRASAPLYPYPCFPHRDDRHARERERPPPCVPTPASPVSPCFFPPPRTPPCPFVPLLAPSCPFVPLLAPSRSLSLPLVPEESTSDTLQRFSLRVKTKKVNLCFAFFRCSRKVYPFLFLPYFFPVSSLPHENSPLSVCPFVPLLAPLLKAHRLNSLEAI